MTQKSRGSERWRLDNGGIRSICNISSTPETLYTLTDTTQLMKTTLFCDTLRLTMDQHSKRRFALDTKNERTKLICFHSFSGFLCSFFPLASLPNTLLCTFSFAFSHFGTLLWLDSLLAATAKIVWCAKIDEVRSQT